MSLAASKIRLIMELRRLGITDVNVLSALEETPRERFVPEQFHDQTYDNIALPIGMGQTISQPYIVARMTQELHLNERLKVLEVGTGSGYQSAVLARLCRRLYTIEVNDDLHKQATKILDALRIRNYTAISGDGRKGWPEQAPFDRMIVTAASDESEPPPNLLEQLAVGGIMIIPLTLEDGEQYLVRIVKVETKDARTTLESRVLCPVRFVPLVSSMAEQQKRMKRTA